MSRPSALAPSLEARLALRRLRRQIEENGWCRKAPARVLVELVASFALSLAGIALFLVGDNPLLQACGMLVSTAGSLGVATNTHTSSHQATSSRPWVNELLTYFGCPFFLGFSATYWWHKHLALHHPTPNVLGRDPDMDLWPWFALTESEVSRARGLRRSYYDRWQWLVFPFMVAFNGFNMQRNGLAHLAAVGRGPGRWRRAHTMDVAALLLHLVAWVGLPALYFPLADVVGFYLLRIGLMGYAMFAVFAPGHYPAEAIRVDLPPGRTDLALLQTCTTLNFRGGWLARLVCSGLDYQIEHHLFPDVPHTCYRRMSPLVRQFCLEQGWPYRSLPWGEALWRSWMVLRTPQRIAQGLQSLPVRPVNAANPGTRQSHRDGRPPGLRRPGCCVAADPHWVVDSAIMTKVAVGPSRVHGLGAFAGRESGAGEVILWIDDSRVVSDTNPLRPLLGELPQHCDYLAGGRVVLMQAPERHINSSCDPNTYVRTIGVRRAVVALRRIKAGEEITYDYILNCHGGVRWKCNCGARQCRGQVPASFFELARAEQRRLAHLLDAWFIREHQDRVDALTREMDAEDQP